MEEYDFEHSSRKSSRDVARENLRSLTEYNVVVLSNDGSDFVLGRVIRANKKDVKTKQGFSREGFYFQPYDNATPVFLPIDSTKVEDRRATLKNLEGKRQNGI
mgnify:CR=1 FL=1